MEKKATTKKISDKSEKKETKKKLIAVPRSPKKIASKKKGTKKIEEKTVKKVKAETKVEKKPIKIKEEEKRKTTKKKGPAKGREKTEQSKKKPAVKRTEKRGLKSLKKAETGKNAEKPAKKVKPKVKRKAELKETLPAGYEENGITLMTVDPLKIFTFWEVREDTLSKFKGDLAVRVYDMTNAGFDKMNECSHFDLTVSERIGGMYIDAAPEKEFVADIGIVCEGVFISITRSNKVSTPRATASETEALSLSFFASGFRIGY